MIKRSLTKKQQQQVQAEREAFFEGWTKTPTYKPEGTLPLEEGRRFFVKQGTCHKTGWFEFIEHVVEPSGHEYISCYGPYTKAGKNKTGTGYHALRPEVIARVEQTKVSPLKKRVKQIEEERQQESLAA
tara:strand:- start:8242 stop:8628 length:387 start_codon:yes stop_codon:yes gene_type:complete